MSVTDPSADPVQPEDPGQGEEGTGNPAYAEYLDRIPDEARSVAEEAFKAWDANWTRQSQEQSEYRKTWEPYQDSGVTQYDPEAVQNALAFYEAASNDPQSIKQWYEETYAPAHNLTAAPPADAPPDQFGQDFGSLDQQQLTELLEQKFSPFQKQLEELSSWRQQQEETRAVEYGQSVIDQQLAELKSKHGDEFSEQAKEWVEDRANKYVSDPMHAIPRAWDDYQSLVNAISKQVIQSKVDSPAPAEGGGVPDVTPEKIPDFKAAEAIAKQFLRNENSA